MEEQIELKLFTVADLKQFFLHNQSVELLSERVINHTRAYATIMNPYVTDNMGVVSAIFVNTEVAAYTYVFPDQCFVNGRQRMIYWNTVLYVDPRYEGRGYGAIVIGQMMEQYGDDYFDLDAVPASIENLKFAGLQVDSVNQYYLEQKHINTSSLKGKLAYKTELIRQVIVSKKKALQKLIDNTDYTLRYVNYIDDETYAFIQAHSDGDLFLRSQEMFNWILTYPFAIEYPLIQRVKDECFFHSIAPRFLIYAIQVWYQNKLVGVYILRDTANELYLEYLYVEEEQAGVVYASIAEHILHFKRQRFFTASKSLADWLNTYRLFAHYGIYHKSFSHPKDFMWTGEQLIQAGDGDNII